MLLKIGVTTVAAFASAAVAFLPTLPTNGLPPWMFFGQIWPSPDDLDMQVRSDQFLKLFVWLASLVAVVFVWLRG